LDFHFHLPFYSRYKLDLGLHCPYEGGYCHRDLLKLLFLVQVVVRVTSVEHPQLMELLHHQDFAYSLHPLPDLLQFQHVWVNHSNMRALHSPKAGAVHAV
jgi:hypothetical protein